MSLPPDDDRVRCVDCRRNSNWRCLEPVLAGLVRVALPSPRRPAPHRKVWPVDLGRQLMEMPQRCPAHLPR
jgi:hypothetical protein